MPKRSGKIRRTTIALTSAATSGRQTGMSASGILGDVADDGRADSQVKKSIVARNRKNQDPKSKRMISKTMQNVRGKKDAHQYVDSKREPTGANVLQDLDPVKCFHEYGTKM